VDHQGLEIGKTYFALWFADEKLRFPDIETLIYLGLDKGCDPPVHVFQPAWSFSKHGNWLKLSQSQKAEIDEPPIVNFEFGEVEPVCDVDGLIEQLNEWRQRVTK
jgi:hypothetical protein